MAGNAKQGNNKIKAANWQFWLIIALPMIYAFVFAYIPMGGIVIAFKDYSIRRGIMGNKELPDIFKRKRKEGAK